MSCFNDRVAPLPSTTTVSVVEPEAGSGVPRQWKEDMALMRRVCDYRVHREALSAVAMSADNFWIFSASHDSVLKVRKLSYVWSLWTPWLP